MSEDTQATPLKYNFEQTVGWAQSDAEDLREDGSTFLYVFGGIAFLFIFASILLFWINGRDKKTALLPLTEEKEDGDKIEEIIIATDATTEEVEEFELVEEPKPAAKSAKEPEIKSNPTPKKK